MSELNLLDIWNKLVLSNKFVVCLVMRINAVPILGSTTFYYPSLLKILL